MFLPDVFTVDSGYDLSDIYLSYDPCCTVRNRPFCKITHFFVRNSFIINLYCYTQIAKKLLVIVQAKGVRKL